VWHGRGDWKFYADSTGRFVSEFGFAAAPSARAWRQILPRERDPLRLSPRHASARWHDKTLKGYETFIGFVELHYPPSKDLEEWSYYSQLNQRDALRFGIEHFRSSEFCKGALVWQLNDCWPVQSWAVVDSHGDYKAAAYELRRLFAPALASITLDGGKAALTLVLDNATAPLSDSCVLEAYCLLDGRLLGRAEGSVTLAPGERRRVLELEVTSLEPRETIVTARFASTTTFRLLGEPKEARLVTPRLFATLAPGGIVLRSDRPVVDLFLADPSGETRFLDNFVTLPSGGEAFVRTEGAAKALEARSLAGKHPVEL
jgi:beta-mannosidase